tara:strand:- start:108 stop:647 length:540 start_codon:yes stop_codon:yes gene_type:complete
MLSDLPAELLLNVLRLACKAAADFARAALSCTACCNALEQAVQAHMLRQGIPLWSARPWLQLSPFMRIRMPWAFLLRVAEVRPRVLEALGPKPTIAVREWYNNMSKHDAPTAWCISNEVHKRCAAERAAKEEAARVEQAKVRAAEEARKHALVLAIRERARAQYQARVAARLANMDMEG